MMAPAGLMCACMCVYYVLHDRPLTLHWSDRSSLEATVISPDLSKASAPPPIFIMTISNFNFQFLPPSSSQFATKLHPCERRWGDCRTRGCKNIYDAAGGKSSQITIDYCHIECKCMFVWVCVRTCNIKICPPGLDSSSTWCFHQHVWHLCKEKQLGNLEC